MKSNSIVPEPGAIRYAYIVGGPPETGVHRLDRGEVCARPEISPVVGISEWSS